MVFIERNRKGEIISLKRDGDSPDMESKQSVDSEILDFFSTTGLELANEKFKLLSSTDAVLARVLEDLIDLLVRKNLIMFTELPEEAQRKIQARMHLRKALKTESIIVDDVL